MSDPPGTGVLCCISESTCVQPVEAFINSLVTPLVLLAVAVHQIRRNAHGHLSIETMPRGFARNWLGGRFTTTTHHHLHHETALGNYGLWLT